MKEGTFETGEMSAICVMFEIFISYYVFLNLSSEVETREYIKYVADAARADEKFY